MKSLEHNSMVSDSNERGTPDTIEQFDPKIELERIRKSPRGEKAGRLKEYKWKFFAQKEKLADLLNVVVRAIEQDSNIPPEKLFAIVDALREGSKMSDAQYNIAVNAINEFAEIRDRIKKIREQCPGNTELYEKVFGKKPRGKIDVREGPISLEFTTHNMDDFETAELPVKKFFAAFMIGGGRLTAKPIQELEGASLIMINGHTVMRVFDGLTRERTIRHERQHSLHDFFKNMLIAPTERVGFYKQKLEELRRENPEDMNLAEARKHKLELAQTFAKYSFEKILDDAKDEFLANTREGFDWPYIGVTLLTPKWLAGYGFVQDMNIAKKYGEEILGGFWGQDMDVFLQSLEVKKEEYKKIIRASLGAAKKLDDMGWNRDKIVAFLEKEPIKRWGSVVKDFVAVKTDTK